MRECPISTALISVSDKSGLDKLAKLLDSFKVKILSTGGTAKWLREKGIEVTDVSSLTDFPEILDGRVKTLHPKIFGGILAKADNAKHENQLTEHNIPLIDLVVCNLYPFEEVVSRDDCTPEIAIENIDIGGPSLIRAAAKNFSRTLVVTDPKDYHDIISELEQNNGKASDQTRANMANKAFALCSEYNQAISDYFTSRRISSGINGSGVGSGGENESLQESESINLTLTKECDLRYGENPHQKASMYLLPEAKASTCLSLASLKQLHGKELSYNNLADINAGIEMIKEFEDTQSTVIIKHTNPCGIGVDYDDITSSYDKALACDPISAFGGIVICNSNITSSLAEKLHSRFFEVIVATGYEAESLSLLQKKKNIRLIEMPIKKPLYNRNQITQLQGGVLIQDFNDKLYSPEELRTVTARNPSDIEREALYFAWKAVKQVKSNAIVLATLDATIGIGAGQMSRVDALDIAIKKSQEIRDGMAENQPLVLASDAFFPFKDVVELANKIKVTAIIQPGGSIKDQESIDAANEHNIAMLFTGTRQFKH